MGNHIQKQVQQQQTHTNEAPINTPLIYHFYHLWVGGNSNKWKTVLNEHLDGLMVSGLLNHIKQIYVGFVGPTNKIKQAQNIFVTRGITYISIAEVKTGFEQVTISQICDIITDKQAYILYCHNKGSYRQTQSSDWWRQSMTVHVVHGWRRCIKYFSLRDIDAIGIHWITHESFPLFVTLLSQRFFGGNFWWATVSYLRTLGVPKTTTRFDAELWIGTNSNIKPVDLKPGWPDYFSPNNDTLPI